jgi:hypothetical protein
VTLLPAPLTPPPGGASNLAAFSRAGLRLIFGRFLAFLAWRRIMPKLAAPLVLSLAFVFIAPKLDRDWLSRWAALVIDDEVFGCALARSAEVLG